MLPILENQSFTTTQFGEKSDIPFDYLTPNAWINA